MSRTHHALVLLATLAAAPFAAAKPQKVGLAGEPLDRFPYFHTVRSFHAGSAVRIAVDLARLPRLAGATCSTYVIDSGTVAAGTLVDVRPQGPQAVTFDGATIAQNTVIVAQPDELDADAGAGLGVGYDVVLDCDRDGVLGDADLIDGRQAGCERAGGAGGVILATGLLSAWVPAKRAARVDPMVALRCE